MRRVLCVRLRPPTSHRTPGKPPRALRDVRNQASLAMLTLSKPTAPFSLDVCGSHGRESASARCSAKRQEVPLLVRATTYLFAATSRA